MPLFKGTEPFRRALIPAPKKNSKVYYCEETKEVFQSYEKLFDRMLMLNSSLWTCAVTLKSGLTFEEAMKSEKNAHSGFPLYGQRPLYFFVKNYFQDDSIDKVVKNIMKWMSKRFFKGEWVKTYNVDRFTMAKIVDVTYKKVHLPLRHPDDYTYKVECYDEIEGANVVYECSQENLERLDSYGTQEALVKYFTQSLIKEGDNYNVSLKLALSLKIDEASFTDFFTGPDVFCTPEEYANDTQNEVKTTSSAYAFKERNAKIMRNKMLQERIHKGNESVDESEMEVVQNLPEFTLVSLPNFVTKDDFGQLLTIYTFLKAFSSELELEGTFSFRTLLKAVYTVYSQEFERFIYIFISARNECVATEDFDEADVNDPSDIPDEYLNELAGKNGLEIKKRCKLLEEIRLKYGHSLQSIPVDQKNITEILNLTLQTSGFCPRNVAMNVRKEKRGLISCADDELLQYSLKNPQVIQKLSEAHISALSSSERLELLHSFVQNLLTYGRFRTVHETMYADFDHLLDQTRKLSIIEAQYKGEYEDTEKLMSVFRDFKFKRNGHSKKIEGYLQEYRDKPSVFKCLKIAQMKFRFEYFVQEDRELLFDIHKKAVAIKIKEMSQIAQNMFKKMGGILLGTDRHLRKYYYIYDLSIVLIENENKWRIITSYKDIGKLMTMLLPCGKREGKLLAALKLCVERIGRTSEAFGYTEATLFQFPTPGIEEYKMDLFAADNAVRSELLQFGIKLFEKAFIVEPLVTKFAEWKEKLSTNCDTVGLYGENDFTIEYNDEVVVEKENVASLSRVQRLAVGLFQILNSIQLECMMVPFIDNYDNEFKPTITLVEFMKSLLKITSESQFFVHLSVFENMIRWTYRSYLQGKCIVCSGKGPAIMLTKCLCCNNKAHLECLDGVEKQEWTCNNCIRKAASSSRSTARKMMEKAIKTEENDKENGFDDIQQPTSTTRSMRKRVRPRYDDFIYNDQFNGSIKSEGDESQDSSNTKRSRRKV
ncbi:unnamed protein product [Bursaphelenchus okinawaensis]|uniref:WAC domain-containing protein n=1 Tax=Bursaphelenchus okinawaensis TaxID=465554 RepID=A0A811K9C4_9BILA|nr:unnamed protein product [Bursaphelenchus okinawaensis]CAG9094846.1 unnamed protein product [Bursaphelenchus okinawaensis]